MLKQLLGYKHRINTKAFQMCQCAALTSSWRLKLQAVLFVSFKDLISTFASANFALTPSRKQKR